MCFPCCGPTVCSGPLFWSLPLRQSRLPHRSLTPLRMSKHQATCKISPKASSSFSFAETYAFPQGFTHNLATYGRKHSGKPFHHRGRNIRCFLVPGREHRIVALDCDSGNSRHEMPRREVPYVLRSRFGCKNSHRSDRGDHALISRFEASVIHSINRVGPHVTGGASKSRLLSQLIGSGGTLAHFVGSHRRGNFLCSFWSRRVAAWPPFRV